MKPQPKELPFKTWLFDEAAKLGITPVALHARIRRGRHSAPKMRKENQRVIFVVCQ